MNSTTVVVIIIAGGFLFFLWAAMRTSSLSSDREEAMRNDTVNNPIKRKIRIIQTYFFDDNNRLSFEKFSNYVLCIKNDEHESKYLEYLAELELLIACCDGMRDNLFNMLLEERSIIALVGSENEFKQLQGYLTEKKFIGTYGDFCYVLFTTVFYLKNKLRNNEQK